MTWLESGTMIGHAIITALGGVMIAMLRRTGTQTSAKLDEVVDQVTPNSGGSLRDAVDRIDAKVHELADIAAVNRARIEQLEHERPVRRPRRWRA